MADIARVLEAAQRDDPQAATQLLPRVYTELRKLAAAKMARELPARPSSRSHWCMRRGCA